MPYVRYRFAGKGEGKGRPYENFVQLWRRGFSRSVAAKSDSPRQRRSRTPGTVNVANGPGSLRRILHEPPPTKSALWYVPMMQRRPSPTDSPGDTATTVRGALAAVHAHALYRPVPPVECDEDGYPFSDARPMPEGDFHGDVLGYARSALQAWFAGRNVYASTDKFLFLEEGNRRAAVAPDILVALGPPGGPRQSYKHWEEGKAPDFILEVLSADNWRNDVVRKPALYADLGVREYWIFDPRGVRTDGGPPLEGWHFGATGRREAIPSTPDGGYRSQVLGLEICRDGRPLRFRDPETGEVLPDYLESEQMRRRDAAARHDAESRAVSAESRAVSTESRASSAEARAAAAEARLAREVAARRAVESRAAALEKRLRGR